MAHDILAGGAIVAALVGVIVFSPVFLVGTVLAFWRYKIYLRHQERRMEIESQARAGSEVRILAEIDSLRRELAGLRDTCTQFDMSIEHRLVEHQHRIEHMERRTLTGTPQPVGSGEQRSETQYLRT